MDHTFSRHQILNITTGRLYTSMDDIYDFFDKVIKDGIMTHMLPNARMAIVPLLQGKFSEDDKILFDSIYEPESSNKEVKFTFTDDDKKEFWKNYSELPSALEGKKVIVA